MAKRMLATATAALVAAPAIAVPPGCATHLKNPQRAYLHHEAGAAASASTWAAGAALETVPYTALDGKQTGTLASYLDRLCTTGLLVLHQGQVVFERYLQGVKTDDALLSASMSKTVLSLLVGIAVSEGRLTLDAQVKTLLPDFGDSAFADDSVEDLLRMGSGAALRVSYAANDSGADNQATNPMLFPARSMRQYLRERTALAAGGRTFNYTGAVTALLGILLAERTGVSNTEYLAQKIWGPMGAERSAYWIRNQHGEEGVQGQMAASLRDYGRLGLLVMNQGALNGRQIVPASWISQMAALRRDRPQPPGPPYYGLHAWIPQAAGGRLFFAGSHGQYIFVDPVAQMVMVHTGNSRDATFDGDNHLFGLRNAIAQTLRGR